MRRKEQLQEGSVRKLLNSMHTCRFTAPQPHIPPGCENRANARCVKKAPVVIAA